MAYYRECPHCGAALDPGEKCDCEDEREKQKRKLECMIRREQESGQYVLNFSGFSRREKIG